jgi:HSP20 family protein
MAMVIEEKTRTGVQPPETTPEQHGLTPWEAMERRLGEFGRRGWLHPFALDWPNPLETFNPFEGKTPRVDLLDRDQELVLRAELPGVKKDDLKITMGDHFVTIRAHGHKEQKQEDEKYYRYEMSHGTYERTLTLPVAVDDSKVKATFENGVLELTLPKLNKATARTIKVE